MGLSFILALNLSPGPCARAAMQRYPTCPSFWPILQSCLSTTAQPGSHRDRSHPGHHHQLTFSMRCGMWPTGYSLCLGLFPYHPWLPIPSKAVCSCFQAAFSLTISCNHHKKLKKKSHLYLHTPGYSHITTKHNLLIIFSNYADKLCTEIEVQTYRFTLFMLP